jgi:DNA-binding LacI/PurR family transcriptional regulator/predicted transcriptional regulator
MSFRILSPAVQMAEHLKSEILRGRWRKEMPGVIRLSAELGVNRTTIEAGLRLLENQGLLVPRGPGKQRQIVLSEAFLEPGIRVTILPYQQNDTTDQLIVGLRHELDKSGFSARFASKSLAELGMRPAAVAKLIEKTDSDAWIVLAGSREVLKCFEASGVPTFAMFGQRSGLNIAGAGPDKLPALRIAVCRLLELGHRRISLIASRELREPTPGPFASTFLSELENHGIPVNPAYNLPDWGDSGDGLRGCLDRLFRHTGPTALILDQAILLHTAQAHLARKGILSPEQISLVCSDPDPAFGWAEPSIAHIRWEPRDVARRAVRWANRVARGMEDTRQTFTRARFIEGGTIGPRPRGA